jgi:hypothetical protein
MKAMAGFSDDVAHAGRPGAGRKAPLPMGQERTSGQISFGDQADSEIRCDIGRRFS